MGINAVVNGGLSDSADLPEALRRGSQSDGQAGDQARDVGEDALPDAAECRDRHRQVGRRQGLLYRRQDRHLGKGGRRALFQEAGAELVHRDHPGRQPAIPATGHAGRAEGAAGNPRFHHLGLERGADRRQGDFPDRAAFGHRTALRPAAVRPPYSCGIEDNPVIRIGSMIRKSASRFSTRSCSKEMRA